MQIDPFEISTQTTGFGSPARVYTKRRDFLSPEWTTNWQQVPKLS